MQNLDWSLVFGKSKAIAFGLLTEIGNLDWSLFCVTRKAIAFGLLTEIEN